MGVCSLARDREILMWNRAMEELTGIDGARVVGSRLNALPNPWQDLFERFLAEPAQQHLYKQRLPQEHEQRWLNLHKATIDEPLAVGSNGTVLVVEDISETQLLEARLIHSERLASIGRLAAGVAHEIGNPVTGIACLAQNLREEREADEEIDEISSQIIEQTRRITRIVQSLMSFAHAGGRQQAHEPVCVAEAAQEAIALLSLNRQSVDVDFFNLCDPDHLVQGDPQRLVQVMINLLSNARDASPPGAPIRVRSEAQGQTVTLSVEDEGSGIPKAIVSRLFEPFFTTKDPGKGTGLGLALVYSIVEEHYGQIMIDSPTDPVTGQGTRIRVLLPRYLGLPEAP